VDVRDQRSKLGKRDIGRRLKVLPPLVRAKPRPWRHREIFPRGPARYHFANLNQKQIEPARLYTAILPVRVY